MLIELVEIVFSGTRLPPFLPLLEVVTVPDRKAFLFLLCASVIEPHMTVSKTQMRIFPKVSPALFFGYSFSLMELSVWSSVLFVINRLSYSGSI